MPEDDWPRIAVIGTGAVGCYFGGMLARAGAPVTLIGRALHVEAIHRDGLFIESVHFKERVSVSASTEIAAARDAQIVLFSVKTVDTENAAKPGAVPRAQCRCSFAAERSRQRRENSRSDRHRGDFRRGLYRRGYEWTGTG